MVRSPVHGGVCTTRLISNALPIGVAMAVEPPKDRIVILGRPSSGKSVFLTVLYHQLWDSPGDLTVRAGDGNTHAALLRDFSSLAHGEWLPATTGRQEYYLELSYKNKVIPLAVLDYPGELFRQLFFEKRLDNEELESLYQHVSRALGVILLIDPRSIIDAGDAQVDGEYSAIQVVEHVRSGSNGRMLPFVVVFTKRDENAELIKQHGGLALFTRKFMPRLARILAGVPIVHLCAVRTNASDGDARTPWMASSADQVAIPLRLVLERMEANSQKAPAPVKQAWRRLWRRWWRPFFIVAVSVLLFVSFFALGVLVAP